MERAVLILPVAFAALALAAGDDGNAGLLPDGPGKEVVAKMCVECHSVDRMRTLRISKDDWSDKVADMVDRGATGTDAEIEAVLNYLAANFGKDSKVWMNTAPGIEMKALLGFKVAEVDAVVAYRKANGNFKEWSDLLKVPGLDQKNLEAKKDLMQF
ncbi:MAG: helix-hairpin-helix domain-containing protein [Candidatus Sulfopaludibacter sp.]|nr:helix-hairpin-helix domain-containing protein [Candidatus Sulfopaludibacter sp.]